MKKIFQILFFVLISNAGFATEKKDSIGLKGNRSSVYFGGSINYLFPDYYNTYYPSRFTIRPGSDIIYCHRINRFCQISTGITINRLNSKSISDGTNTIGDYRVRNTYYLLVGIPVFLSLEIPIKKKLFVSIESGIIASRLIYNKRTACDSIGICLSATDFINGSKSLFLTAGVNLNFVISKKIILKTGMQYYYYHFNLFESSYGSAGTKGRIDFLRFSTGLNIRF